MAKKAPVEHYRRGKTPGAGVKGCPTDKVSGEVVMMTNKATLGRHIAQGVEGRRLRHQDLAA